MRLRPIIYIIFSGFIIYFVVNQLNLKQETILSPIVPIADNKPSITLRPKEELSRIVNNILVDTKGKFGISIKNLKTGKSFHLNEHEKFETASLYKLWVMAETVNQIQQNRLDEQEVLSESINTLYRIYNISPDTDESTDKVITLNVIEAMNLMIANSDNYAALLLSNKVRLGSVQSFLKNNGLAESSLGEPPVTTPSDIALFFEKLYQGQLADSEHTQKMLAILKKQTKRNKLPKYLPASTIIAHKTGELGSASHDAGIVFSEKGDYIIVVLSKSSKPATANETIANIGKAVYNYFLSS